MATRIDKKNTYVVSLPEYDVEAEPGAPRPDIKKKVRKILGLD